MKYNKVTGRFENPDGSKATQKAVKDGLGNNVKDYIYNPAENKFEHKDELVHNSPLPVGMPREPKIHTPAYRRKYPERYNKGYLSKEYRLTYPKEKVVDDNARVVKQLKQLQDWSKPEWAREDKLKEKIKQTRMSDWDLIKAVSDQPEDKKQIKDIIRKAHKRDSKSITRDEIKYLKPEDRGSEIKIDYRTPTYFPKNERIEETPPPNFEVSPDPDLYKGLGSLLATTRKDYKK